MEGRDPMLDISAIKGNAGVGATGWTSCPDVSYQQRRILLPGELHDFVAGNTSGTERTGVRA